MAGKHHGDDERRSIWRSWAILAAMLLAYVIWVTAIYLLIGERERGWIYGAKDFVPGESYYSTEKPPPGPAPKQIELVIPKER